MRILQTRSFNNAAKRRHANQKRDLDDAVRTVAADPAIGETKIGDLAGVRVFKFTMTNQLTLLAYEYEEAKRLLKLLALGSHENFYRDLKR